MAKNAGFTSTKQQLLMNALQSPIMTISTLLGVRFIDRAGQLKSLNKFLTWLINGLYRAKSDANVLKHYMFILRSHGHNLQCSPKRSS